MATNHVQRDRARPRRSAWLALVAIVSFPACSASVAAPVAPRHPSATAESVSSESVGVVIPDCTKQETTYFQCMLRGDAWGAVAICGQPGPDGVPTGLQVRLQTPEGTSVTVPAEMAHARDVLAMRVVTQPQLSYQAVSFDHEGRTWTVFSEHNAEIGGGLPFRGVRVAGADKASWACSAEPIDRLGELEPYLVPEPAEPPLAPVAQRSL